MRRRAHFICHSQQQPDLDANFRTIVSQGPKKRYDGTNRWYLYRRTVSLSCAPTKAEAQITVDGRYQLFVNGERVGRGPCRSSPEFQRVDSLDLQPYLKAGDNCIAVLVHVYGTDTAWYEQSRDYWQGIFGDGGLYVDISLECDGASSALCSDGQWRCVQSDAWRQDTPKSGWGQDFIEDFDARKLPEQWTLAEFDDKAWPFAIPMVLHTTADDHAKGWLDIEPFPSLIPRDIPQLAESAVTPEAVLDIQRVKPRSDLSLAEQIYEEQPTGDGSTYVTKPDALLSDDDNYTTVCTPANEDISILIRFDRLHSGFPFIDIEASGGEVVEVAVAETLPGEYFGGIVQPPRIRKQTFLDCAHVFRYTARAGRQRFEKFEWTGIRYMQLLVRNAPKGIRIRHAGSIYTHYPVENLGAFECSDDFLNRLWEIGRYTTLQCTHDAWEDCPGREKRQWLGDGLVHYQISAAAFGPSTQAIDRQFLMQGMESQRPDGLLQMFSPGDNHRNGIIIPDFCLHWICAIQHYLLHTGDLETIELLFPSIQRVLSWFERQKGQNSLLANMPYWHFIEWANVDRSGESSIINAMLAGATTVAAELADELGYQRAALGYREKSAAIASALNMRHWDVRRGVYVDSVDPETGSQKPRISQQANAAMIYWDVAPQDRWQSMLARITDTDRLKLTAVPPVVPEGEDFDEQHDVVLANTYFSHFVFSALAKARRFDLALAQMRRSYEPMLATGTTTLWESFDPTASLCHAFSATGVYQLSANTLGVQPTESGFRRALIAPQPGNLQCATGVYPTIHGDIAVNWTVQGVLFELSVDLPEGIEAEVVAPPGYVGRAEAAVIGPGSHRLEFHKVDTA